MLCKPKCLADIRLLPPRRRGVLRFSELMRKAHPWVLAPRTWWKHFLENLQCEHTRLEVAQMINFLKTSIKGVLENVDVWISPLKTEEKKLPKQVPPFLPCLFFTSFFFLCWLWFFIKFFINDMVLVRAIVSFSAVTLKSLCCDSC